MSTMEGMLTKLGGNVIKRHQDRWFELQGARLRYYENRPLGTVHMPGCEVADTGARGMAITGEELPHTFTLTAPSDEEKQIWLSKLRRAVEEEAMDIDDLKGRLRVMQRERDELQRRVAPSGARQGSPCGSATLAGSGGASGTLVPQSSGVQPRRDGGGTASTQPQTTASANAAQHRDARREASADSGGSVVRRSTGGTDRPAFLIRRTSIELDGGDIDGDEGSDDPMVIALRQQLSVEREEQRQLREDLHQEIDRLQKAVIASQQRMHAAEQQAQDLLSRAARAARSPRGQHARTVSDLPGAFGCVGSMADSQAGSIGVPSGGSMPASTPTPEHPLRGGDDSVNRSAPSNSGGGETSQLQGALDQKMLQQYIELRKVLHELQETAKVDFVEHVARVAKHDSGEKLGVNLRKPGNAVVTVQSGLAGARAGVKPGMRIVQVDGVETRTADEVMAELLHLEQKKAKTFDLLCWDHPGGLILRLEGQAMLAEERDAMLVENDELRQEVERLRGLKTPEER